MTRVRDWQYLGKVAPTYHLWRSRRNKRSYTTSMDGPHEVETPQFDGFYIRVRPKESFLSAVRRWAEAESLGYKVGAKVVQVGCTSFNLKVLKKALALPSSKGKTAGL